MDSRAGLFLRRWYGILRLAHLTAARNQAVERVEKIEQVYKREERANSSRDADVGVVGWGLGSFGLRDLKQEPGRECGISSDDDNDGGVDKLPSSTHAASDRQVEVRHRDHVVDLPQPAHVEAAVAGERQRASMWWWGPCSGGDFRMLQCIHEAEETICNYYYGL